MIKINFCKITSEFHPYLEKFLEAVPVSMKEKLLEHHFVDDQLRSVIGKLLLKKLLVEEGYPKNVLEQLKADTYDRPFIDDQIDFNISHSGNYVVCAVSRNTRLGVDVERIKNITIDDFNIALRSEELEDIKAQTWPVDRFFSIWTQKEAVSKANGKGFEVLLTDIVLNGDTAISEKEEWKLFRLDLDNKYMSYIAYKGENDIVTLELKLDDLVTFL